MKPLIALLPILLTIAGCSAPGEPEPGDLSDGEFYAIVGDRSPIHGIAEFHITAPDSAEVWEPQDTLLFLSLSVGEIQSPRGITVSTGIFLSSIWQGPLKNFELNSTTFVNSFLDPQTLIWYDIGSGSVYFKEQFDSLMTGTFELIAESSYGGDVEVSGAFRAILEETQ